MKNNDLYGIISDNLGYKESKIWLDVNKEELTILDSLLITFQILDNVLGILVNDWYQNLTVQDDWFKTYVLSTNERNWILVKNQYEGYEYIDPNHQYTYPNSTVVKGRTKTKVT